MCLNGSKELKREKLTRPYAWGTICGGKYPVCSAGKSQSPINVVVDQLKWTGDLQAAEVGKLQIIKHFLHVKILKTIKS